MLSISIVFSKNLHSVSARSHTWAKSKMFPWEDAPLALPLFVIYERYLLRLWVAHISQGFLNILYLLVSGG